MITALSAAVQGTFGFGFAVVSVPILSLLDRSLAPVPQLLITLPMTLWMAWRERGAMDLKGAGWVVVGRFPGALIGIWLLKAFDDRVLDVIIALMVLGAVGILATGVSVRPTRASKVGAGIASGTAGMVSSIGGPPVALLYRDSAGSTIRSSLGAIFTVGIIITITGRSLAGEIGAADVRVAVLLFPALVAGLVASRRLTGRVEGRILKTAILALSALAAVGLMVKSLTG